MDERIIIIVTTELKGEFVRTQVYYMNECPKEARENPALFFTEMYKDQLEGRSSAHKFVTIIKMADINDHFVETPSVFEKPQIEREVEQYLHRIEARKKRKRAQEIETLKELAMKYPEVLKVCVE